MIREKLGDEKKTDGGVVIEAKRNRFERWALDNGGGNGDRHALGNGRALLVFVEKMRHACFIADKTEDFCGVQMFPAMGARQVMAGSRSMPDLQAPPTRPI